MKAVKGFSGEYRFLSNFWYHPVKWNRVEYDTNEHAYQVAKDKDPKYRAAMLKCKSPGDAKQLGRTARLRPGWDSKGKKVRVMAKLIKRKFRDSSMRQRLLSTGAAYLEETNRWHDNFWGNCTCKKCGGKGLNMLGKLLMAERKSIRENE